MRYPQYKDFIDMGMGIEGRYQRNFLLWEKHLLNTKTFIENAFVNVSRGYSLAIFGAGRLFDIPASVLCNASNVHLFDADPLALSIAQRKLKNLRVDHMVHLGDCTGVIQKWEEALEGYSRRQHVDEFEFSNFLGSLPIPIEKLLPYDVVISLNILGQIPIYLRERLQNIISKRSIFAVDENDNFSAKIEEGISRAFSRLQHKHIEMVYASSNMFSLYVYDREFYYYHQDFSQWDCYSALYTDPLEEILGIDANARDSWLWHIAPQGVEEQEFGAIHKIEALLFKN